MVVEAEKPPKTKKAKAPSLAVLALQPEKMAEAGANRPSCTKCGLLSSAIMRPYIPAEYTGKLLVVTSSPPDKDERLLIREITREVGYGAQDVALTYAVRCPVEEPSMQQIRCCRPFLVQAVQVLNPQQIIAMGPSAARAVSNDGKATNITKLRGRPLLVPGTDKVAWATYAPRAVILGGG